MPHGKPAGVPCIHLTEHLDCALFGKPERPSVCGDFQAEYLTCGNSREEALQLLGKLEADARSE